MIYKTQAIIMQNGAIRANVLATDDLGQTSFLYVDLEWKDGDTPPKLERRAERKLERREEAARAARVADPLAKVDLAKPLPEELPPTTTPEPKP